jgi:hypothetical protein
MPRIRDRQRSFLGGANIGTQARVEYLERDVPLDVPLADLTQPYYHFLLFPVHIIILY